MVNVQASGRYGNGAVEVRIRRQHCQFTMIRKASGARMGMVSGKVDLRHGCR